MMSSKSQEGAPQPVTARNVHKPAEASVATANASLPGKPPVLWSVKQVADMLGVSVDWVQAHATSKEPRIDHVRAGKLIRFTPQQVADFVRRQTVAHAS